MDWPCLLEGQEKDLVLFEGMEEESPMEFIMSDRQPSYY
jgi:hypothetical protein